VRAAHGDSCWGAADTNSEVTAALASLTVASREVIGFALGEVETPTRASCGEPISEDQGSRARGQLVSSAAISPRTRSAISWWIARTWSINCPAGS
jgi:hypothetical protein